MMGKCIMENEYFILYGELKRWPTKRRMAGLFRNAGLNVSVGRYSIRIEDFDDFAIEEYGGDLGEPQFVADCHSLPKLMEQAGKVSAALANAEIRHRFEIYNVSKQLVAYLHHDWPLSASPSALPNPEP
jgi:hypothetical protein